MTAIKDAAKAVKSTGELEQNLIDLESNKPEPLKVPRLLYGDATPKALAHRLAHEWPVGGVLSETVRALLDDSKGLARGIGWESTQGGRMFKEPPEHWPCLAKFHRRLGALFDRPLIFNNRVNWSSKPWSCRQRQKRYG